MSREMLARVGLRVCAVDKDCFPSDTLSTHAIQPAGVQGLDRLGVLGDLLKIAPPIGRGRMVFDDDVAFVDDVIAVTAAPALSIRRVTLDEPDLVPWSLPALSSGQSTSSLTRFKRTSTSRFL